MGITQTFWRLGKLTIAAFVCILMLSAALSTALWFTADKEHVTKKEADGKFYLLYTGEERAVFVSEKYFRQHQVGDQIRVAVLPTPGMGIGSRLVCVDFGCD